MTPAATLYRRADCEIAESPCWDVRIGRLVWTDVHRGVLMAAAPDAVEVIARAEGRITAVSPRTPHGYVVATDHGFALVAGDTITGFADARLAAGIRMNDGSCDPLGRFWAGSMRLDGQGSDGRLLCLHADGSVSEHADRIGISNGIDFSPDGSRLYHVDSGPGIVRAFEFDPERGRLGRMTVLADHWQGPETPDGLVVDAEGYLWVAIWRGGRVERLTPAGAVDSCVRVPAPLTTSCAFGEPDASVLYITTARHRLDSGELSRWPESGGIFSYTVPGGLPGRHPNSFAQHDPA